MAGWVGDIEQATIGNATFRTVLFTGTQTQLTVMRLLPGEEIGLEVHEDLDQFIRVESGSATLVMGPAKDDLNEEHTLEDDWAAIIPGGTWHNVINRGDSELKLYSLYSPPEHPEGTVHVTKAEADAAEHDH